VRQQLAGLLQPVCEHSQRVSVMRVQTKIKVFLSETQNNSELVLLLREDSTASKSPTLTLCSNEDEDVGGVGGEWDVICTVF